MLLVAPVCTALRRQRKRAGAGGIARGFRLPAAQAESWWRKERATLDRNGACEWFVSAEVIEAQSCDEAWLGRSKDGEMPLAHEALEGRVHGIEA